MSDPFRFRSPRWAYAGGGLAVVVVLGVKFLIGGIYGVRAALDLISALQQTSLYFGAAIATASATIMALMLTLLGFARRGDTEFDEWVFRSINRISTVAAFTLGGSILLLLMLQLPVGEFEKIPHGWYSSLYFILVTLIALLAGLMISTVLMLLSTVRYVISHLTPGDEV
ncbi:MULTISPECIES: hypothetical protein [Euryhalocaulis]|uniref:hypothetical protein n=1 Tax=Euryhalocaulis TaxID=1712422 RepID=UPI0003A4F06F|nr:MULTISPECIES: hypothetical protein [Euryhalocaulis]MBA4803014.1 hypothetical protein [Euryhalocaulis sp.]